MSGKHRSVKSEPYGWLGAGVVLVGMGIALSGGSAVAAADDGAGSASQSDTGSKSDGSSKPVSGAADSGTKSDGTSAPSGNTGASGDTEAPGDTHSTPPTKETEPTQVPDTTETSESTPPDSVDAPDGADDTDAPTRASSSRKGTHKTAAAEPESQEPSRAVTIAEAAVVAPEPVSTLEPAPAPVVAAVDATVPVVVQTAAITPVETVSAPSVVEDTEPVSGGGLADVLAPLFGSDSGDAPVESPGMWVLAAAARNEFEVTTDSLLAQESTGADPAPALVVDGSVTTGDAPSDVAVTNDRVFVTNRAAGTMTVLRRSDHSVLTTVAVGASPTAVVVNSAGTRAYIANATAATVTVLDITNYTVVARIKVGSGPTALALTPDGTRLMVVNTGSNSVTRIDTAKNKVTKSSTRVGGSPSAIAITADGKYAYVTNAGDGSVTVITISNSRTKVIGGVGSSPSDIVIAGNVAYVSTLGGAVTLLSTSSNSVTGSITVGAPVRSLAIGADGKTLYAGLGTDTVAAIDIATGTVWSQVNTDPTGDGVGAPVVAVAGDGTIYQTDSSDDALRVLYVGDPNNAAPQVAAPVVGAPDPVTGVVTGHLRVSDHDGDTLTYTVIRGPGYGALKVNSDGSFTYTPSLIGQLTVTEDHFVIGVSDGQGRRLSAASSEVTVAVLPADATLKTGTYSYEPPILTTNSSKSAEYTRRKLLDLPVEAAKLRVHIANFNLFQDTMAKGGSLDDINLWIGEAAVGADGKATGQFVPGTQVQVPIKSTLAAGQWGVSDWLIDGKDFDFDPAKQYIFSYGFGTPGGKLAVASGGVSVGWGSRDADDAGASAVALTATTSAYLDVWFEYQYEDTGQPSVFIVSNSAAYNLSGAKGTRGEIDTWVNQWAEKYGGVIAGNIAVPAVWSTAFDDPNERWNFYDGQLEVPLDPDAVVYMVINSSDVVSGGGKLAKVQQDTLEVLAIGQQRFPNALQILSEIPPRTGFKTKTKEAQRKAMNAWMDTLPGGADAVIPIGEAMSDGKNPARMLPQYTIDGIHWTPAGVAVVVDLMGRTINGALGSAAVAAVPLSVVAALAPMGEGLSLAEGNCPVDPTVPCVVDPVTDAVGVRL